MKLTTRIEDWHLKVPFRISGMEWTSSQALVVELTEDELLGRGEGAGVFFLGETVESMLEQVLAVADIVESGVSRTELLKLLPAGGARNAVDCALWDLEARRAGCSIWDLTKIAPQAVTTVFTIGIEKTPEEMAAKAAEAADYPVLKIKLDARMPVERLRAIRAARPDAQLVVDANQGWDIELLEEVLPACADLKLEMIEQPLPRGADAALEGFDSPITLAADESCLHSGELEVAARRYDMINIKLDKTGGLTEALNLAYRAKELGCKLMIGNMVGTSLAMAPAFVVAQICDFVDIDGPLLLQSDREVAMNYQAGRVDVFDRRLWG